VARFVTRKGWVGGTDRLRPRKRRRRRSDLERPAPAGDRFELVILDRPGFPPNPPVDRVDFDNDGDHLVGHSYGGVITLLAAARVGRPLGSLTAIEPSATGVALGNPVVDRMRSKGGRTVRRTTRRRFFAASSRLSARTSISPPRSRPSLNRARGRSLPSAAPGRRRSHSPRWPTGPSRSSSSPAHTTWPSTRSATSSSGSFVRSGPSSSTAC